MTGERRRASDLINTQTNAICVNYDLDGQTTTAVQIGGSARGYFTDFASLAAR
jgi:hypothetical protein